MFRMYRLYWWMTSISPSPVYWLWPYCIRWLFPQWSSWLFKPFCFINRISVYTFIIIFCICSGGRKETSCICVYWVYIWLTADLSAMTWTVPLFEKWSTKSSSIQWCVSIVSFWIQIGSYFADIISYWDVFSVRCRCFFGWPIQCNVFCSVILLNCEISILMLAFWRS